MVKKQSIIKDSIVKGGNNVEEVTFVVTDFENEIKGEIYWNSSRFI